MVSRVFAFAIVLAALALGGRASAQASDQVSAQHRGENGGGVGRASARIAWALTYNSDLNADVSGGVDTGGAYLQRIGVIADADLDRMVGWRGATAHLSLHSIAGTGLSGRRVGNLLTVSGIEAEPALRLFNLWVEQNLGDGATLRLGQFTAGQEFAISSTAGLFVNSTFGWPASFATDLPSGGPAYPLAAPGARLAWTPDARTTVRLAVFSGDPAGRGEGDPQRRDRGGLNGFRLMGKPFVIGELSRASGGDDPAWAVVVGGWAHFHRFDEVAAGAPGQGRRRNYAAYAILDGRLWASGGRSLHGFVRGTASPSDRNPIDLYLDGGLTLTGPLRGRPNDVLGLGAGWARLSPGLRSPSFQPPRFEGVIEASYQWRLKPGVYLQPNFQVILHPSGAVLAQASGPAPLTRRAVVLGLRTSARL